MTSWNTFWCIPKEIIPSHNVYHICCKKQVYRCLPYSSICYDWSPNVFQCKMYSMDCMHRIHPRKTNWCIPYCERHIGKTKIELEFKIVVFHAAKCMWAPQEDIWKTSGIQKMCLSWVRVQLEIMYISWPKIQMLWFLLFKDSQFLVFRPQCLWEQLTTEEKFWWNQYMFVLGHQKLLSFRDFIV